MSYSIQQPTDGSFQIVNGGDAVADIILGGPATPTSASPRYMSPLIAKIALGVADTGGGILSWLNPHSYAIAINRIEIDVTTKTTGACTADFGITATNATTSNDSLVDGVDIGTAVGLFDNITNAGTNGKSRQKLAVGAWVTGTKASGAAAGLVGFAYIHYHPATA